MVFTPRLTAVCLLIVFALPGSAAKRGGTFNLTASIRAAYTDALHLKLDAARRELEIAASTDPGNLMAQYVQDCVEFLDVSVSDDMAAYQSAKAGHETRLRLITLGDVTSPFYLFVQGEMYLHRALLRLQFGEEFSAATDLNQAFRLLKRNQKRFPDFLPNLKTLGILKAAFGTLPDNYQWALELLSSMEGSVEEGLGDLETALSDPEQFTYEESGLLYLMALLQFKNAPDEALNKAHELHIRPSDGPIQCLVLSHIAMKAGRNDLAISWLETEIADTTALAALPQLDLLYGAAKLRRLDPDADVPLFRFLSRYGGGNYRKEALQKLAWQAMVQGEVSRYQQLMEQCKSEGNTILEGDRYAMSEAESGHRPLPSLLMTRLLFDGGYYFKALEILDSLGLDEMTPDERLEYRYRAGRIYSEIGREYDALFSYKIAIAEGKDMPAYYGCAAALYAGLLYERKEDYTLAEQYFRQCLDMDPDEYRTGLHQKAKAGLSRIKARQRVAQE